MRMPRQAPGRLAGGPGHPGTSTRLVNAGSNAGLTAPNPPYRIQTDRLVLRCWSPADAPALRPVVERSDAHLRPLIAFMKDEPRTLVETAHWLRGHRANFDRDRHYRFAMYDASEETLLGEAMLLDRHDNGEREVGYWTDVDACGRGFATEASAALIAVAFELLGDERVDLGCAPTNAASVAVARKLGFHHDGTLRERFKDLNGDVQDLMQWSLLAAEYPTSPPASRPLRAFDALGTELLAR